MAAVSISCFSLGIILVLLGIVMYRAPQFEKRRRFYATMSARYPAGAFFAMFPGGIALFVFGFFPLAPDQNVALAILLLAVLGAIISFVFFMWTPSWTVPWWMRDSDY